MRKLIPMFILGLAVFFLTGCSLSGPTAVGEPTLSDDQMQTQISSLLTAQPTATQMELIVATATPPLPTAVVEEPAATAEAAPAATEAPTEAPTLAAEATATLTPVPELSTPESDSQSGGGGPTPTAPPTLTPAAGNSSSADDPRGRLGNATSTDDMDDPSDWVWPTGKNEYTAVEFTHGVMNLTSLDDISGWRLANPAGQGFGNLYLEATIKTSVCSGNDQYGLIARVPVLREAEQGYLLGLTCDGRYSFRSWDGTVGEKGKMTRLVDWTASSAIHAGSNQTNRLGLLMTGSTFKLYVNGVLLGEVKSSTYGSGYFGLFVGGLQTDRFAITVDEMAYWENP